MLETPVEVTLDLTTLPDEVELSQAVSKALALAASVVLDRTHGSEKRIAANVLRGTVRLAAEIRPTMVDARARASYGDPQEATEEGAEGIGVSAALHVLDRIVFRRLPKGTGADYLMRDPSIGDGDGYERLECSGIADGEELATARLRTKLGQLARYPTQPPGHAVVTSFRATPVEIHIARHPQ
jgi:hypothetical protein